jgi:hypothetical protein
VQLPTPTPRPAPDSSEALARDQRRLADLLALQALLNRYFALNGAYPDARFPQTLCAYPGDGGCALRKLGDLPADPRGGAYRLWTPAPSRFLLITSLEALESTCSASLPPEFATIPRIACLTGENGR